MRHGALVFVLVLALGQGGCALVDWLSGANSENGERPFATQVLETVANHLVPGAGTLIAAGLGTYAEVRRRKWKKATIAQAQATHLARTTKSEDGKIEEEALLRAQAIEQDKLGVRTLIKNVVAKIETPKV